MSNIGFHTQTQVFKLKEKKRYKTWISQVLLQESRLWDAITYVFCDDEYLLEINLKYLKHNTLTDIITFNYQDKEVISGDIMISIERVRENAHDLRIDFEQELRRVMVHGILHLCGYPDHSREEKVRMRKLEEQYMGLF